MPSHGVEGGHRLDEHDVAVADQVLGPIAGRHPPADGPVDELAVAQHDAVAECVVAVRPARQFGRRAGGANAVGGVVHPLGVVAGHVVRHVPAVVVDRVVGERRRVELLPGGAVGERRVPQVARQVPNPADALGGRLAELGHD
jgi:hypothetical protein